MPTKKKHAKFTVPNFGSKSRKRVPARWRKQRGIDSKKRVERKGYGAVPKVGYKNSDDVRFSRKDGTFEVLVHNEKELLAMLSNGRQVAVFAHGLSRRKRASLQRVAEIRNIRVANEVRP